MLLENVAMRFKQPSVLDFKMGTTTVGPDHSEEEKRRVQERCRTTTSARLGFRLSGMQVRQKSGLLENGGKRLLILGLCMISIHWLQSPPQFQDCNVVSPVLSSIHLLAATAFPSRLRGTVDSVVLCQRVVPFKGHYVLSVVLFVWWLWPG